MCNVVTVHLHDSSCTRQDTQVAIEKLLHTGEDKISAHKIMFSRLEQETALFAMMGNYFN